jgi:hypothetical protein
MVHPIDETMAGTGTVDPKRQRQVSIGLGLGAIMIFVELQRGVLLRSGYHLDTWIELGEALVLRGIPLWIAFLVLYVTARPMARTCATGFAVGFALLAPWLSYGAHQSMGHNAVLGELANFLLWAVVGGLVAALAVKMEERHE